MADQAYQAVGVLAGRLEGDRIVLIDGEEFAATPSPVLRQWLDKNPEAATSVRIWLAYPRTLKPAAGGLAFFLVGTPEDQSASRWQKEIDRFEIKGQAMDSRANSNFCVIRIPRNAPAPKGKRRERNWLPHLLFLQRALRPVRKWKGVDVQIAAKRDGRHLFIAEYKELKHRPTTIALPVGATVPWPIRPTRSAVSAVIKSLLPPDHQPAARADIADDLKKLRTRCSQFIGIYQAVAATVETAAAAASNEPLSKSDIAADLDNARKWGKFFDRVLSFLEAMEPGQLAALCKSHDPLFVVDHLLTQQLDDWFSITNPTGHRLRLFYDGRPIPRSLAKSVLTFYGAADVFTPRFTIPEPPTKFFASPLWAMAARAATVQAQKKEPAEPVASVSTFKMDAKGKRDWKETAQTVKTIKQQERAAYLQTLEVLHPQELAKRTPMDANQAKLWAWENLGIPVSFDNQQVMAAIVRKYEEDGFADLQIRTVLGLLPIELSQLKRIDLPQEF